MVDRYNSRGAFRPCKNGADTFGGNVGRQNNNMNMGTCGGACKCGCKENRSRADMSFGNGTNKNECKGLLEKLCEIEFSLIDTVLYLDAYPHSGEALAYYKKLKAEREELIRTLSMSYGKPMTMFDNCGDTWSWTEGPWPWEACAN